ncbi:MAG: hypothetical protein Q9P44_05375 [Anaerolineae bacterium]|nr:hypothetical protein [Anaerolineae bacterium]
MRLIIVSLVLMMILAACSTTDIATDAPFYTATARITEPIARPTEGSIGLPDFVGGDPQIVASTSTFQYTVSGDVSDAVTRGSIVYNYVEATGNVSARDKIFISTSDANASQQLSFEFSPGLVPDTYPLTSPADSFLGSVTAQYLRLSVDGDDAPRIQAYRQNIEGTLTLSAVGETISGVFEFSAQWVTGNSTGETVTRTVSISGAFTDVPYSRLSTPFDSQRSVPERATPQPLIGSQ